MKIAFYDDEAVHRDILLSYLEEFMFHTDMDISLKKISSANELIELAGDTNILLLDIKLEEGINGIRLAKQMRQRGFNGIIILITSAEEYVFQGYEIEAFRYLMKPLKKEELFKVLNEANKKHKRAY